MAVPGEAHHGHGVTMAGTRIDGLNETVRSLQRLGVEVDDLKDVMADIAEEGARYAAAFAPKRSGRLAGTIRGNRAKGKAVVAAGRGRVKYAGAINYGWKRRHIAPSMFMQRADAKLAPVAVEKLEAGIDRLINDLELKQ